MGRKKGLFREIQTAKAISGGWAEAIAKSVGRTCQFQRDRLWWEGAVKLEQPGSYNGGRWARLQSKICRVRSAVDKSELIKKYMPPCGQSWPEGLFWVNRKLLHEVCEECREQPSTYLPATLLFT